MPDSAQKMKIRADILSILNKYRNGNSEKNLSDDIKTIKNLYNKSSLCTKILLKEITDGNSDFSRICAFILNAAIDNNVFEKEVINFLNDEKISDDKKFFLISVARQKGMRITNSDISRYVKEPKNAAKKEIKNFMTNAINNPEVQIDLMDFYQNIPKEEKLYFLDNLIDEFNDDDIANAFSLLSCVDIDDEEASIISSYLISSNSPLARYGLETLYNSENLDKTTKDKIKKTIMQLNFRYPKYLNNSLIKNSKIYTCYIGFVDGRGDFLMVFSRKNSDNLLDIFLITIRIPDGITACVGFGKIVHKNYSNIKKRIFRETPAIPLSPIVFKSIFLYYFEKNKRTNTKLPYEIFVWKNLLNDVKSLEEDLSVFLNSKLQTVKLKKSLVKKLIYSPVYESWFFSHGKNKYVDEIIDEIEKKHITDLNLINEIVLNSIEKKFLCSEEFLKELHSMLLIQAFIANQARLTKIANLSYSLCFKNSYLKYFLTSMVDKSIYCYLSNQLYLIYEDKQSELMKKIKLKTSFSKDELEFIMLELEEKWN